jgi:hypothetical protein
MLTQNQITAFETNGYLVVENLLDSAQLAAIKSEYSGLMERLYADWQAAGRVLPCGTPPAPALPSPPTPIHRWQADSPACA